MSTISLSSESVAASDSTRHLIARNALYLTVSQVLAMPLSVFTTAVTAHYLGAEAFGYAYLAMTLCAFGFLAVGWGHEAVIPAAIARDRGLSGVLLGSSLLWRAGVSVLVYAVLASGCYVLGYPPEFQWALGLTSLFMALASFVAAGKDAIRGFERTDIPAYVHFGQQVLTTLLLVTVVVLGGKLRAALLANSAACAIVLVAMWVTLRPVGIGALSARWDTVRTLFTGGMPFVVFGIAMALQPTIDALFLSKLAPVEVIGWYAVSRRLVGALLLPATALIGALYPTLCRLYATDRDDFTRTARQSLMTVGLLAVPMAVGCALFPEIGVSLFSRTSFGPAEDNLRVQAMLVVLVYFSMPLGTCILAAGRQRAWSFVQCFCVVASLILDPLLVPLFQQRTGNGGLGLCVASVVSEAIMIACGVFLAPSGVFDRRLQRFIGLTVLSGAAMAAAAEISKPLGSLVAVPVCLAAYGLVLWLTGGINRNQMASIWGAMAGKLPRAA